MPSGNHHQMVGYNIYTSKEKTSIITYTELYRLSYLSLKHFKVNLFLCRHFETSSSRLLSKTLGSALNYLLYT